MQLVDFTSSPLLFLNLTKKQWVAPDPNNKDEEYILASEEPQSDILEERHASMTEKVQMWSNTLQLSDILKPDFNVNKFTMPKNEVRHDAAKKLKPSDINRCTHDDVSTCHHYISKPDQIPILSKIVAQYFCVVLNFLLYERRMCF